MTAPSCPRIYSHDGQVRLVIPTCLPNLSPLIGFAITGNLAYPLPATLLGILCIRLNSALHPRFNTYEPGGELGAGGMEGDGSHLSKFCSVSGWKK